MPFVKAQCTNCGGLIEADDSSESAVCPFCKTPYFVDKAIKNYHINNKYEIHNAQFTMPKDDVDTMAADADALLNQLNRPSQAYETYQKITQLYPRDYRGWLGIALYMIKKDLFDGNLSVIGENINRAIKLFPAGSSSIAEFYNQYKQCVDKYYEYSHDNYVTKSKLNTLNPDSQKSPILFIVLAMLSPLVGLVFRIVGVPGMLLAFSIVGIILVSYASFLYRKNNKIADLKAIIDKNNEKLSLTKTQLLKSIDNFTIKFHEINSENQTKQN